MRPWDWSQPVTMAMSAGAGPYCSPSCCAVSHLWKLGESVSFSDAIYAVSAASLCGERCNCSSIWSSGRSAATEPRSLAGSRAAERRFPVSAVRRVSSIFCVMTAPRRFWARVAAVDAKAARSASAVHREEGVRTIGVSPGCIEMGSAARNLRRGQGRGRSFAAFRS